MPYSLQLCRNLFISLCFTALANQNRQEQEQTTVLAGYLSKSLKFTEADGLHLSDGTPPEGFLINFQRCSHRTMCEPRDGFVLIISEERTWCTDVRAEQNRKTVRIVFIKFVLLLCMVMSQSLTTALSPGYLARSSLDPTVSGDVTEFAPTTEQKKMPWD